MSNLDKTIVTSILELSSSQGTISGSLEGFALLDGSKNFTAPVGGVNAVNQSDFVTKEQLDNVGQGTDWQDSVLNLDIDIPAGPFSNGDRYVVTSSGATGDWTGHENDIAVYDGGEEQWLFTSPEKGFTLQNEDDSWYYNWNGTSWVSMGSTFSHGSLLGLANDDHPQYFNEARGDLRYATTSSFVALSSSVIAIEGNITTLSSSVVALSSSIVGLWSDYTDTSSSLDSLSSSFDALSSSFSEVSSSWSAFSSSYVPYVLPDRLIANVASLTSITNWNSATDNGWFRVDSGVTNGPSVSDFYIGHNDVWSPPSAIYLHQTAYSVTNAENIFTRQCINNSWSSWVQKPFGFEDSTAPSTVDSSTASIGTSKRTAHADHTHNHGDLLGGSLHALATTALAGFMSSTDKAKLDGIETGTWSPTYTPVAGLGSLASINRGSHYIRVGSHLLCMCVCRPVNAGTTSNNPRRMTISIPAGYALSGNQYYVGGTISEWTFAVTGNDQATRIGAIGGVTGESSVVHCSWNNTGVNSGGSYGIVCLFWCADISKT